MALGKRAQEQQGLWVCTTELPASPGHPFYQKLNQVLAEADFDRWIEDRCRRYYAAKLGRPSLPPGVYFRMVLVGYFEGIASQRGIAWRCSDSRSLAEFLGIAANAACDWRKKTSSGSIQECTAPLCREVSADECSDAHSEQFANGAD